VACVLALTLALGTLTVRRNRAYASELSIWEDTAAKAPENPRARYTLGVARAANGDDPGAIEEYHAAVRLNPGYAEARNNLANALRRTGQVEEAETEYRTALRLIPDLVQTRDKLGLLLASRGREEEAAEQFEAALAAAPGYAPAQFDLGNILWRMGRRAEALGHFQAALKLAPESAMHYQSVAWLLATQDADHGGDAGLALEYARRAGALTDQSNPWCLDTLGAAEAAAGRYEEAAAAAQHALQLARVRGRPELVQEIQTRLELYRAGRPYREKARAPSN
jgi:tetratricopeptide (TPR) repeat protein